MLQGQRGGPIGLEGPAVPPGPVRLDGTQRPGLDPRPPGRGAVEPRTGLALQDHLTRGPQVADLHSIALVLRASGWVWVFLRWPPITDSEGTVRRQ